MKKSDFYYDLPKELIAQHPVEPRDSSKLLVYNRKNGDIEHRHFFDVCSYLKAGDVLVINNTKVLPARLFCKRENKDALIEILLLKRLNYTDWECLAKPAKKVKIDEKLTFSDKLTAKAIGFGEEGTRILRFEFSGVFEDIIAEIGAMPLPPYITEKLEDKTRYQTVYSKINGSAAAPTAGLHFTSQLLDKIKGMGVQVVEVLLHVGLGTFRPVKEDEITDHKMHSEYYEISEQAASVINAAKSDGRRVIAVGTTSVRTLESAADERGFVSAKKGDTSIFIYPPYNWKVVSGIITNFHLPESTLIMLVSAFVGREQTLKLYDLAVAEKYRFFSFGDAMFLI